MAALAGITRLPLRRFPALPHARLRRGNAYGRIEPQVGLPVAIAIAAVVVIVVVVGLIGQHSRRRRRLDAPAKPAEPDVAPAAEADPPEREGSNPPAGGVDPRMPLVQTY
jgi:hypothetical protein